MKMKPNHLYRSENAKNLLKILLIMILCAVTLFIEKIGQYWYNFLGNFQLSNVLLFLILIISLTLVGVAFIPNMLGETALESMKMIPILTAIDNRQWITLLFYFPITMLFEELLFRGILLGSLIEFAEFDIFTSVLLSSAIFGLYHIHIWFVFKNKRMTIVFITYSFVLGILCGVIFPIFGILGCTLFHYLNVFAIYLRISGLEV